MLPYIPHVALLIGIAFIFYKVLLEKETFFKLNRWLLVASLLLAFLIPSIEIPATWSIWSESDTLWVASETDTDIKISPITNPSEKVATNALSDATIDNTNTAVLAEEPNAPSSVVKATPIPFYKTLDWKQILWMVYLVGVMIFGINLLIQFFALLFQIIRSPSIKDGKFRIIEMSADKAPYSFLNCVFINPSKYDWETYDQIIKHEKIHISQAHSIDMILAELLVVLQWFNPAAWYYRKAIENNLEYLTDSAMLHKGVEAEPYQLNLLKVSVPHYPIGLAMNYNQSILKKRIKMMNAKKSSVRTSWKYLAIMPILGLSIICFNAVKVVANQQTNTTLEIPAPAPEDQILNGSALSDVINEAIQLGTEIAENVAQEEVAKVVADLEDLERSFNGASPREMKGVWQAEIDGSQVCVRFDNSDLKRNSYWISTECFGKSEFSGLPTTEKEFTLERAAGKVIFNGKFEGSEGLGRYRFEQSTSFVSTLKQEGVRGEAKEETLFHFFLADMDRDFVRNLKNQGYKDLRMDDLKKLAIHDVDEQYIKEMAQLGYDDLSLGDLVKGRIHDVDPSYIKELKDTGFDNLNFNDLVKFSIHDVNADMVQELADAGFTDLNAEEIVKASIHNVTPDYIQELKSVGYALDDLDDIVKFSIHNVDADLVKALGDVGFKNLSPEEITKAAIHNVNEDYVREMAAVGYELNDISDIIEFSIHNVDADFVKALKSAGYKDLSSKQIKNAAIHNVSVKYINDLKAAGVDLPELDDVVKYKIHGVSVNFIEALEKAGYKDLNPDEIRKASIHGVDVGYINDLKATGMQLPYIEDVINFSIHGVRPSYIKDLQNLGYKDLSAKEIQKAKIHGVRPSTIKELNGLGFENIPMKEVIEMKIHGVSPRFIKDARAKGYKDLSLEEYKKIKIHGIYRN
ncbi:MAG: hypothetical protein Sapg2KO_28160 [Saprospiraceae bacterium]